MMSGYIVRSSSVVMGGTNGPSAANSPPSVKGSRESPTLASPLQIFVHAKKRINDIFNEIETYLNDASKFVQGYQSVCYIRL